MQTYTVKSLPPTIVPRSFLFLSPEINVVFSGPSLVYISKDMQSFTLFLPFCVQIAISCFNLVYLGEC